MDDVKREARDGRVDLVVLPTAEAIKVLQKHPKKTNAVLDVNTRLTRRALTRSPFGRGVTRSPAERVVSWPRLRIAVPAHAIAA